MYIVRSCISDGWLVRASALICVDCGKQARDYDHRDYERPLDIDPVCRRCNQKRGPAKQYQAFHAEYFEYLRAKMARDEASRQSRKGVRGRPRLVRASVSPDQVVA